MSGRLLRRLLAEPRHARREAVPVPQIDVAHLRPRPRERAHGASVRGDEAGEARRRLLAAELERRAVRPCRRPRDSSRPRSDSRIAGSASASDATASLHSRQRSVTSAARPSGPANDGSSPFQSATNISPSVLTSAVAFQRASGTCSSTVTSSRLRPLAAQRDAAHPGDLPQRGARAGEVHREERARRARRGSPPRPAARWRARAARRRRPRGTRPTAAGPAIAPDAHSRASTASAASVPRRRHSAGVRHPTWAPRRMSTHRSRKRDASGAGGHRDQRVPGHARRRVHLEERVRPVGPEHEVEPAPAGCSRSRGTPRAPAARIASSVASGRPAGQWYFVSSEKYLFW